MKSIRIFDDNPAGQRADPGIVSQIPALSATRVSAPKLWILISAEVGVGSTIIQFHCGKIPTLIRDIAGSIFTEQRLLNSVEQPVAINSLRRHVSKNVLHNSPRNRLLKGRPIAIDDIMPNSAGNVSVLSLAQSIPSTKSCG